MEIISERGSENAIRVEMWMGWATATAAAVAAAATITATMTTTTAAAAADRAANRLQPTVLYVWLFWTLMTVGIQEKWLRRASENRVIANTLPKLHQHRHTIWIIRYVILCVGKREGGGRGKKGRREREKRYMNNSAKINEKSRLGRHLETKNASVDQVAIGEKKTWQG